jgi:hypothetical protein
MRRFIALVVVAFVFVSALTYGGAPQRVMTGTVLEIVPAEWLRFGNETTDPTGIRFALVEGTRYTGDFRALAPGGHVRVRYRHVGDRSISADAVEVLSGSAVR